MSCLRILSVLVALGLLSGTVCAQVIFSDDFEDGDGVTRWSAPVVGLETPAIGSDGNVDYAFDYSAISNPFDGGNPIPPAPNSAPGTTTGVYITSNNTDNCPGDAGCVAPANDEGDSIGIVSNFGLPATGNYKVTGDLFLFWNGGGGSTEYTSFGINHQGSDNAPLRFNLNHGDGLAWQVDTDGDSGTDIIRYEGTSQSGLGGWEDIPNGTIPGVPTGDAVVPGIFSQWVEVEITHANGTSGFRINGALIDHAANLFSGGGVLIGHSDAFNSVNNPINGFTSGSIWDNITVTTIPEPTSAVLIALGVAGLVARRRVG